MLVIHGSPWITILFGTYYHCTAPISRHTHKYWSKDTSFYVLPKGLSYWFLEVEGHRNWVMTGFRDCPLFEVNMAAGQDMAWNTPSLLNAALANFFYEPALKFANLIFCCRKRRVLGVIWQLILTLVRFGAYFFMFAKGFGKISCSIPTSMQASLLK